MVGKVVQKNDPVKTREAVAAVKAWVAQPGSVDKPSRSELADACRRTVRALAEELPGQTVELRVPPFVAVQCVEGPRHTRGTPPNVVETDPLTWLQLATGQLEFDEAVARGVVDASGSRCAEIAAGLPVVTL
ncbi:sterol carrier family protein [Corynebacterium aquatimens]|uniref:Bacterial SCP orthologue domain-containing protein n=1 Tax=Corynebacterium aquatimens TaxID=1190508 RepID=A0A931GU01_9CORY|nr:sterol carrier family protein [Corynebacterium aquatimens]MBG6122295.1 hypothetical protein [Corynebacterium aquatimens]WJY65163.1 hypothetical protein CAQUA_02155 [Corynebacterium aquatimens]